MWLLSQQGCHPDLMALNTDAACDVLCESVWDGSLQEAKAAREPLYGLLQLQPRLKNVGTACAEVQKADRASAIAPERTHYLQGLNGRC